MAEDDFRKYEPFFGEWRVGKELGRGAFGHVYEVYREDVSGERMISALKVMHIPKEEALRTQMEIQPDTRAVRAYFSAQIERMREEIRILKKCRGHSNIVSYEEHMIVEESGTHAVGWDILIRMERLYPVSPRTFAQMNATQYDVLRMWRDIANALIFCEEQSIIHRDVKPANILLSASGSYKLTDFGVARELMEQSQEASTRVGTEPYMAPEVYTKRSQKYDRRADIYSLGRVIYYYLNQNRHAFLPSYPQELTAEDTERAELMRLGGEKIPKIDGVSREINDLLLKCLAFRPSNRPGSARELHRDIEKILEEQGGELKRKPLRAQSAAGTASVAGPASGARNSVSHPESERASFGRLIPIAAAAVCLIAGMLLIGYSRYMERREDQNPAGNDAAVAAGTSAETFTELEPLLTRIAAEQPVKTETDALTAAETGTASGTQYYQETGWFAGLEAEIMTEKMTETLAETGRLPVEETENEEWIPGVRLLGQLESPQDGDEASTNLKVKGWVLVDERTDDLSACVELSMNGETVKREELELTELSEKLLQKRQRDYQSDIAAVGGYEFKKTLDVAGLAPGTYELLLYIESYTAGNDTILQDENAMESGTETDDSDNAETDDFDSAETNKSGGVDTDNSVVLMDSVWVTLTEPEGTAGTEAVSELSTHYKKNGYAIGLDLEDVNRGITANNEQILVSGWINAPEETSLSMVYVIDSVSYIRSTIEEAGGSVWIIRSKRNLEQLDSALVGESVLDMEEAGFLILLSLPFLEDGAHTLQLSPNVGLKETGEDDPYDFAEFTLFIDSTIALSEITEEETGLTAAADAVLSEWAAGFPEEKLMEEIMPE